MGFESASPRIKRLAGQAESSGKALRERFLLDAPVGPVMAAFADIAGIAKDLEIVQPETQMGMGSNGLDVIDDDAGSIRGTGTAAQAPAAILGNHSIPELFPFERSIKGFKLQLA